MDEFRAGYAAILGKPNVGKSTLLNGIVGEKIAIVSDKPQTTRDRLLGIYSDDARQIVFVDTPGIIEPRDRFNRYLASEARGALEGVDVALHLVFGVDDSGFFIDTEAVAGPELSVSNLSLGRIPSIPLIKRSSRRSWCKARRAAIRSGSARPYPRLDTTSRVIRGRPSSVLSACLSFACMPRGRRLGSMRPANSTRSSTTFTTCARPRSWRSTA